MKIEVMKKYIAIWTRTACFKKNVFDENWIFKC